MSALWRIECFGSLRATTDEGMVAHFRTRKVAQLLALLALSPRDGRTRDALAETLWPDEDTLTGRNRLKQTLSLLRHDLSEVGEPPIATSGKERVAFERSLVTIDVAEFEIAHQQARRANSELERLAALSRAANLYTEPLLTGFYEDDFLAERTRLEEAFLEGEEARITWFLATGKVAEARAIARRCSRLAPDSERARTLETQVRHTHSAPQRPTKRRASVPAPLTPLFGRTEDLRRLLTLLIERRTRLITLLGPGGIGKTRLALEAARGAAEAFDGAVWFVSLAAESSAEAIPAVILSALRQPGEEDGSADSSSFDKLVTRLSEIAVCLLVLDNLESLGSGVGAVLQRLLERLPGLSILGTSRQTLGIRGESRVELGPLPEEEALSWFVHQSQAARADFVLTGTSEPVARAICRRLDGMPLALELAAAWSAALTPEQIAARLEHPLELLIRPGGPGADPRHAALSETIEASFRMLEPADAGFWVSLSVFRGGWWLDAAEAITGRKDALAILARLRERSLVRATETPQGMRYSLLAPLREFAATLLAPQEFASLLQLYTDHYLTWSHRVASELFPRDAARSFALLEEDEANIVAALLQGLSLHSPQLGFALMVYDGLAWHWWVRGKSHLFAIISPAVDVLVQHLPELSEEIQPRILRFAANRAIRRGDTATAEALLYDAISRHRRRGEDNTAACEVLVDLLSNQGRFEEAHQLLETELFAAESVDSLDGVATWLGHLVALSRQAGWHERHFAYGNRCRELHLLRGRPGWAAKIDIELSQGLCARGQAALSEARLRDAVTTFEASGETWNLADSLKALGAVLVHQNRPHEANAVLERAISLWERIHCHAEASDARSLLPSPL